MKIHAWKDVPREVLNPLFTRQVVHTAELTIARIELKKGCVVPSHTHHNAQFTTVERGCLQFTAAKGELLLGAGESLEIPPGAPHGVLAIEDSVVVDLFTPRREDWIAGDDAYLRK